MNESVTSEIIDDDWDYDVSIWVRVEKSLDQFEQSLMNIKQITIVLSLLFVYLTPVHAYETTTHRIFSEYAAGSSKLSNDPSLLNDLGLSPYGSLEFTDPETGAVNRKNIEGLISFGAVFEDDKPTLRFFRHFFDPQFNNFQGRGLSLPLLGDYAASPDWALEDRVVDSSQEYSYAYARQYFLSGLTCLFPDCRNDNFVRTFQTLGQIRV